MIKIEYNFEKIRTLLREGFTDVELLRICQDELGFRKLKERLASRMGKDEIIDRLLEYTEQQMLMSKLLAWAEKNNPVRYDLFYPYWLESEPKKRCVREIQTRKKLKKFFVPKRVSLH